MATVAVDLSQYGLDETKAALIRKDFDAVLKIAEELETDYNAVIVKEITPEVSREAKALRIKYMKVRTGLEEVRKARKAFYLSGGRAVDGLSAAYTHAVEGNEDRLVEIEKHFENIEAARVKKLNDDRCADALKFGVDGSVMNLGLMPADVWGNYIAGVELQFNARKEAEAKVDADRVEKEKAEAEERERIRLENIRLKAEAEERDRVAKIEAEKRAIEEKARLEKEAAERKRIEAEREKERKEADAKLAAERAERERLQKAQAEKEAAERKEKSDAEAREKDTENKKRVMWDAVSCLMELGIEESAAHLVVELIVDGKIKNVSIKF